MTEQQPDERWEAILGMLESIASLDFSRSLPISDEADNMDAVASGLNMLSEELQANVVEKSELAETVRELQWYRSMATASSDLMVLVDPTYTYRSVNQAYCDEHQRTREEILGHTVADVFGKEMFEATLKLHLDRCLKGERVSFDFWWTSPSRGRRHVEARYDPFYEADGSVSGVAVNLRDTTDRRRTEEEQERSVAALEAANLELELFSASLAHDLRNPLLIVTNFSAHLAEQLGDSLDHQLKDDLGRIRAAGRHMMNTLEDLRDLSDVTRGEISREEVDLSSLGREIINDLNALAPDRDMRLEVEPGIGAVGDKTLLRILLTNLLQNAWKYTEPKNDPRIELGVDVEGSDGPTYYVRDNEGSCGDRRRCAGIEPGPDAFDDGGGCVGATSRDIGQVTMSDPVTRLNAALEGRYAIERELGEGGMATVYLADDLRHERKVALKEAT